MFYDNNNIAQGDNWGLPVPNEEAAYKSMSKYAKDMLFMEDEEVDRMNAAWEMTMQHFGVYMRDSRIKSYEEVKESVDMSTSSGAPFNVLYKTKRELFENDLDIDQFLKDDWETLANDPEWTCLATNSLKEELRPTEKIKMNKIRTFTALAVDATIHGGRLFQDMNEKMNNSWLQSASTVGWSPMKGNWDRLIRKLSVFKNGYALDESEYDSSLRSYMMWGCAQFRWNCLRDEDRTPENLKRIKTYYRNLINTLIITPKGAIIMKKTGNPSGSVNTINDNTLILFTLKAYAWLTLNPNPTSLREFIDNVAMCLCGDDNTWTVSDYAHTFYNAKTIIACWKTIGIVTTTDSLEPRTADELDYLSAHTVYIHGVAVPQYDREKIITSLLYSAKSKQTPAQALERTNGMIQVGYCDKTLRSFLKQIQDWLIYNYDKICSEDPEWIVAKCGILPDSQLTNLWLGNGIILQQQSMPIIVKRKKDNKCTINMNRNTINNKQSKPKRRGGKRNNNKQVANFKNTRRNNIVGPARPQKQRAQRQGPPRRRRGNRGQGRMLAGKGNVRNKSGYNPVSTTFDRDEFVAAVTVAGQPNFNNVQFPINPGQAGTFPWLAPIAARFEKYYFEYIEFYYKREVSEFATNGQVGKVMMSVDMDASDPGPATKQQLEDTEPHADGMPCQDIYLAVPERILHRLNDGYYVRPAGLPGSSDIKTYDIGNFNIATQGILNNVEIGELHVRYRVCLFEPVLENTAGAATNNSVAQFSQSAVAAAATTVAQNMALATANANGLAAVNTAGSIVLPAGNYMFWLTGFTTNSGTFTDSTSVAIQKNGATIGVGSLDTIAAGTGQAVQPFSCQSFASSNGTDAFTAQATITYSGGSQTNSATLTILAI